MFLTSSEKAELEIKGWILALTVLLVVFIATFGSDMFIFYTVRGELQAMQLQIHAINNKTSSCDISKALVLGRVLAKIVVK